MRTRSTRALTALSGLLVTGLLVAGCSSSPSPQGGGTSEPRQGGQLVFATDREPDGLDPVVGGDQPQYLIARQYLDSLVFQEADGTFTPWLATSWDLSHDDSVYTFHLRDGVTFSDGTPLNAAAVKANIDHWVDPKSRNTDINIAFKHYRGSTIADDHTIAVDLGAPYADFLSTLAGSFAGIQSPAGIARGQEVNGQSPIGTGPFVVKSWDRQSQVVLERRADYNWAPKTASHQGPAYLDKVVWRFIAEPTTRFGALQTGEADVIEAIPPESFDTVKSAGNLKLIDGSRPGVPYQLDFNTKRHPWDDLRVRQAVRYAADVPSGLKSVFFGAVTPVGGSLSKSTVYYDARFEDAYKHDPAKAKELLDTAGWTQIDGDGYRVKDGKRLVANVNLDFEPQPQEYLLLDGIAGNLKEVGIQLTYDKANSDVTAERRQNWEYDLTKDYWGGPNTGTALEPVFYSKEVDGSSGYHSNGIGYVDPALDAAIDQAAVVTDPKKRQELYSQAQQIISDQALALPLFAIPLQYAYRSDRVSGVAVDPRSSQIWLYGAWSTADR